MSKKEVPPSVKKKSVPGTVARKNGSRSGIAFVLNHQTAPAKKIVAKPPAKVPKKDA